MAGVGGGSSPSSGAFSYGGGAGFSIDELIDSSASARKRHKQRRSRIAFGVSAFVTLCWLVYVSVFGHWDRVLGHWASALTMVFGSFVAGATPQGGGAVAFPVFTKLLEVPSSVARTFSLCIQTVGMTAASLSILINRRAIDRRALAIAAPLSLVGFAIGLALLVKTNTPFGESVLPGAYVKVTFTVVIAAMALVTHLGYRAQLIEQRQAIPKGNWRVVALIAGCALAGGATSALVGSGTDVYIYLAIVALLGVNPKVGVATSVLAMTLVSIVGFFVLGIGAGQLSVVVEETDGSVSSQVAVSRVVEVAAQPVALIDGKLVFADVLEVGQGASSADAGVGTAAGVGVGVGVSTAEVEGVGAAEVEGVGAAEVEGVGAAEVEGAGADAGVGGAVGAAAVAEVSRFDLFGLWLAAVPVVGWGAPIGALAASRATDRQVIKFVVFLAVVETVSTVVFLEELRSDFLLVFYALAAMTIAMGSLVFLSRFRYQIFALKPLDPAVSITRSAVDVGPNLGQQLSSFSKRNRGAK